MRRCLLPSVLPHSLPRGPSHVLPVSPPPPAVLLHVSPSAGPPPPCCSHLSSSLWAPSRKSVCRPQNFSPSDALTHLAACLGTCQVKRLPPAAESGPPIDPHDSGEMGGGNGSDADDEGLGLDWSPPLEELTEEQRRQYLASGGTAASASGRGVGGGSHPGSGGSGAAGSGSGGSTAAALRHQHDLQQQPGGRDAVSGGEPSSSSSRTDPVHQVGGVGQPSATQASTSAASEGPASSHATAPAAAAARGSSGGGGGGRSLFAAARAAATAALDTEAERMRKEASAVFGERWAHKVKRLPAGCGRHVLPHVLPHVSLRHVPPHPLLRY